MKRYGYYKRALLPSMMGSSSAFNYSLIIKNGIF